MLKRILLLTFTLILVTGMVLTGCSKTTTTPTATTTAPTSVTPTVTTPQTGGTLHIISGAEVTSFMVGEMYSPEDMSQRMPVIETLVRYDSTKQQAVPFLAESAIEDSNAKTVTFKLRSGVNFQDGTVCDAAAVKWNLDQEAKAPNTAPDFVDVSSIDVINASTIKVSFSTWDNSFLREMCWDAAMISPTSFEKNGLDWARVNPCGTGPFKLVTFERDVKKVFQKWDGYWQPGKPYLNAIEINIIADSTVQLASLLKGDDDILSGVDPTDVKTVKSKAGFGIVQNSPTGGSYYSLTGDSANSTSPFANVKVRQAISYAIDRESIKKYIFYDYADVTSGFNDPNCWTYNPNVIGYPYSKDKAKALLTEAGYKDGFSTTIYCRPERYFKDMATAIQSNLADIGIKADLQVLNSGQYGQVMFGTGWQGLLLGGNASDAELGIFGRFFLSKAAGIGYSNTIIHPDDVEAAINDMMSATTNDAKKTAAWKLDSLAIDTYSMVTPLVSVPGLTAVSAKVHDPNIKEGYTWAEAWIEH
jgi:peptide/nickel transport system substrate-binding protein